MLHWSFFQPPYCSCLWNKCLERSPYFFIIYFHTISAILIPNFQNKTVAYYTKLIFFQLIFFFFNYGFCTFLRFIIVFARNAKRFAIAIFFPYSYRCFGTDWQKFFCRHVWQRSGVLHWTHREIILSTSLNFVCVSTTCHVF